MFSRCRGLILILNLKFIFFVVFFIIFIFLLFLDHFFNILYVFSFPGTSQHIHVYLVTVNIFVQCVDVNIEKNVKANLIQREIKELVGVNSM